MCHIGSAGKHAFIAGVADDQARTLAPRQCCLLGLYRLCFELSLETKHAFLPQY